MPPKPRKLKFDEDEKWAPRVPSVLSEPFSPLLMLVGVGIMCVGGTLLE